MLVHLPEEIMSMWRCRRWKKEIQSYSAWLGEKTVGDIEVVIIQEKESELEDVFFFD